MQSQDFAGALSDLDQYAGLVGNTEDVQEQRAIARQEAEKDAAHVMVPDTPVLRGAERPTTAQELVDRARAAKAEEDYSTVHYMATLARSIDPDNDEAARLAAEALARLQEAAPSDEESAEAELFRRKQAAKADLDQNNSIEAYYELKALEADHPADVDVGRYLAIATERVEQLGVFRDEIEPLLSLPGTGSFVFVNDSTETTRELVSIGKLIRVPDGMFAHQVEVVRFDLESGRIEEHRSSPYGKLVENSLVLTILDRNDPSAITYPVEHQGVVDPESRGLVALTPTADELWLLGIASADPEGASITDLLRTTRTLRDYGLVPQPAEAELLRRLSLPFTFLILSFFVLGFAWRYRSRYIARPPLPTLVLVPVAPVLLVPLYLLFRFAHRILFSALLLWTGLTIAVILLLVVEAALLVISLMYLALSSRE
jgi:hypothetical protein